MLPCMLCGFVIGGVPRMQAPANRPDQLKYLVWPATLQRQKHYQFSNENMSLATRPSAAHRAGSGGDMDFVRRPGASPTPLSEMQRQFRGGATAGPQLVSHHCHPHTLWGPVHFGGPRRKTTLAGKQLASAASCAAETQPNLFERI